MIKGQISMLYAAPKCVKMDVFRFAQSIMKENPSVHVPDRSPPKVGAPKKVR